jgi:uncharacterized surface protein with fasciclin (FAS1) repeats
MEMQMMQHSNFSPSSIRLAIAGAAFGLIALGGCATSNMEKTEPAAMSSAGKDIVDTAVAAGSFNTLVAAVKQAGLVDTLKSKGPLTVFAPTDAAFAKIPKDQLNAILADKALLTKILTYHVVAGKVMAADVKPGPVKTVQGSNMTVSMDGGNVMIDKAKVIKTDIAASNGVIHVIDSVIVPN